MGLLASLSNHVAAAAGIFCEISLYHFKGYLAPLHLYINVQTEGIRGKMGMWLKLQFVFYLFDQMDKWKQAFLISTWVVILKNKNAYGFRQTMMIYPFKKAIIFD